MCHPPEPSGSHAPAFVSARDTPVAGLFAFAPRSLDARRALMAIQTTTEQIEQLQAAITKIEAGAQSYTVQGASGGVTYTRADLATLYQRLDRLQAQLSRESAGGMRVRLLRPLG